jgi:hypothetical protein
MARKSEDMDGRRLSKPNFIPCRAPAKTLVTGRDLQDVYARTFVRKQDLVIYARRKARSTSGTRERV